MRTCIATIIPKYIATRTSPSLGFTQSASPSLLLANLNALIFDYITRQKIGGNHLSFTILTQLPVLPPEAYTPADIAFIAPRVLELVYTAYDLKPFAEDMGYHGEPFRWDEERRALLRAELDAYYAKLYCLTHDELRYILDPQDVYGPDFPGETFRVLKDKEIKRFGEYRTRRLVLEAWDRLEGVEIGNPVNSKPRMADGSETVRDARQEQKESQPPVATVEPAQPVKKEHTEDEKPAQPSFTDFGLYKCEACGKLVIGFDRESHIHEVHQGKNGEWKKMR